MSTGKTTTVWAGNSSIELVQARHNYERASSLLAWRRHTVAQAGPIWGLTNYSRALIYDYETQVKACLDALWAAQQQARGEP